MSADGGNQGSVEIYGRINNEGWVEDASERNFQLIILIWESQLYSAGTDGRRAFTSEPGLVREGKNLLMSLPRLDMPELHGKTIKATLSW
jgi:hypothetical protein